jgi:hypothetical protein
VLARLDTREQALILGHAVPMPVVVQTRRYDMDFYKAMGFRDGGDRKADLAQLDERTGRNATFAGFD